MSAPQVYNYGPGTVLAAEQQTIYHGEELVEVRRVSPHDLRATTATRFVPPGGEWDGAAGRLNEHRLLVVVGDLGTGRRTAALRLLSDLCGPEAPHDLEPIWKRPRAELLPPVIPGGGYLLDLSEPVEKAPREDFGERLRVWAHEQDIYLVVTTTRRTSSVDRWTGSIRRAVAHLSSPDARALTESELRAAGAADRTALLDDEAFNSIWRSSPKAEDACRLASITLQAADADPSKIADEYRNWSTWINTHLPVEIGPRSLFWSCAFCDGGKRKSILMMAEALRRQLGEKRDHAAVLKDDPASTRLKAAELTHEGGIVKLDSSMHGLDVAVRRHLWEEYEGQLDVLKEWIVAQPAELPEEDAAKLVDNILALVIQYRDDDLLQQLRKALAGKRASLAVRALSKAAMDPRFGAHVRGRLYTWLESSPSQELVDIVAAVCGGQFGLEKTSMALVRLRRAAQKSQPGSQALSDAFNTLASHRSEPTLKAIHAWYSDDTTRRAASNAFLALAAQEPGAKLLYGTPEQNSLPTKTDLVRYFRAAQVDPALQKYADSVMKAWEKFAQDGVLDTEATIELFGTVLAPEVKNNVMQRFLPDYKPLDVTDFWGRVMLIAVQTSAETDEGVWHD